MKGGSADPGIAESAGAECPDQGAPGAGGREYGCHGEGGVGGFDRADRHATQSLFATVSLYSLSTRYIAIPPYEQTARHRVSLGSAISTTRATSAR